jgi:hypothetical protein
MPGTLPEKGAAGHDEGAPAKERLVKCGVVNLYRTFLNDLEAVYLFVLQISKI